MKKNMILMISEKETFLVRAMTQKIKGAGMDCRFVFWDLDSVNASWDAPDLIILFMDEGRKPGDNVIRFIADKMTDDGIRMIPIGSKPDVEYVCSRLSTDLVHKVFYRPVNNDELVESIRELFSRINAGEFKKSILIVDDDPNYLSLVREWLKDTYKVTMANSGLQAIKMLGKNKVDLILLDNEMPVTSGPQVLEMLRSDDETKDIPVMFLTGKGDKESVMAVLALRPEGYFLKNIKKEELLENLKDYFILHQ